ncbi:MAG TPA: ABC transporter ATP-binding protein [Thermoanaerobacterales bacterium]|nr:ABC transporter ATP-binding protein [Thermoanaerobacterales bacterium]
MTLGIEVKNLSFSYDGKTPVLKNINFTVNKGETLAIMGLSGCGKSTLCQCICGIIPHIQSGFMQGDVFIQGENTRAFSLPKLATKVGMVFQDPDSQLFLPKIKSELAFGPENLCMNPERIRQVISQVSSLVGIEHLLFKNPNEISGGEKQIAVIAAVLCLNPEILILDEVSSQLDRDSSERIKEIILELKNNGKTIILTDHNLKRLDVANKVLAMKDGEILQFGTLQEVLGNKDIIMKCFELDE